jgi:hypothetical protein
LNRLNCLSNCALYEALAVELRLDRDRH